MIIRLHVMYQQSRKMLIFLVVTFVVIIIPCVVTIAIRSSSFSRGKLSLMMEGFSTQAHVTTIRRTRAVRHLLLHWQRVQPTSDDRNLDLNNCVGSHHTVSYSMDCCKTPP
jgi:hypothetical protein